MRYTEDYLLRAERATRLAEAHPIMRLRYLQIAEHWKWLAQIHAIVGNG